MKFTLRIIISFYMEVYMRYVKCKTCRHESIVNEQDEFYRCNSYGPYNELSASIPKCSIRCIRCNTP